MINVLMTKKFDQNKLKLMEDTYKIKIYTMEKGEQREQKILDRIEILTGWTIENALELMPNLKWIHLYSAGVDRQIEELRKVECPPRLTNNRGTYAIPLAEHTVAMLFALNRKIKIYVKNQINKTWKNEGAARELCGSTVGIVGFGDVGSYTAKVMKALGAKVLVNKLNKSEKPDYVDEMYYATRGLDNMLPLCDYVLISLPGTEETRNLFNKKRMLKMKNGVVVTNVGRGYVIDCDALAELIDSGHIGGAGLDVTEPEPLNPEHKLWDLENVIITPHVAWRSPNNNDRTFKIFEENLACYLKGERMPNEIDILKGY